MSPLQTNPLRPTLADELVDAVADAARSGVRLDIRGGGSKAGVGAPTPDAAVLDMGGFTGVVDYEPAELVLTVGAATPLSEVEALVAQHGQMLAFAPFDHGPSFGNAAGAATIGGVVMAGVAGSQRLSQGGARDHLLGFEAVSGRGERFVAGAKVVKNVTGYDLPKLAAGSWGRLFAVTQLTLKVLPAPRVHSTRIIEGQDFVAAQRVMALALGSQADVAAAAYLPAFRGEPARTALRIQGFGPSVTARGTMLDALLGTYGTVRTATDNEIWDELKSLARLGSERPLWRINVAPSQGPGVVAALGLAESDWLADWGGGLIWLVHDCDPALVRAAALAGGGHATLVRAPAALRATVAALHPQLAGVAALETRIRRAFDPPGVFETGRFLDCA